MPDVSTVLREQFGEIDIYLFDQLLKGRFDTLTRVLDAGCGSGRNVRFLLGVGFEVFGVDQDPAAVAGVRALAARLAPHLPARQFEVAPVERMPWPAECMDAVLSSAVLHFARDEAQFDAMLREMWRVLRPGGLFFARLASTIGLEAPVEWLNGRRARLPDGSERFVVDETMLLRLTETLGGELLDPLKTTNVHNQRAMTTWCVRKQHVHPSTRHA
jgi:SAM-dependent methyltransferase